MNPAYGPKNIKIYIEIRKKPVAILALHGGGIEIGTEQISRYIAKKSNSSLYVFSGRKRTGNYQLHISSTEITVNQNSELLKISNICYIAVAIHGHKRNNSVIYLSGTNSSLLTSLTKEFEKFIAKTGSKAPRIKYQLNDGKNTDLLYRGEKNHILNSFRGGAIQIELPRSLRIVEKFEGIKSYESEVLTGDTKILADTINKCL